MINEGMIISGGGGVSLNPYAGPVSLSYVGTASTPALSVTGQPYAGTGTTSFPLVYINDSNATASTTLNTAGEPVAAQKPERNHSKRDSAPATSGG